MTDRDTGKPRGFGFIEFFDIPTAESAIRNLSGKDFKGRTIRCGAVAVRRRAGSSGWGGGWGDSSSAVVQWQRRHGGGVGGGACRSG